MSDTQFTDLSGRATPILTCVAAGCAYIFGATGIFSSHEHALFVTWALFPFAQFIYAGPAIYRASQYREKNAMQGWIIGTAMAAVIFSPCWGGAWMELTGRIQ